MLQCTPMLKDVESFLERKLLSSRTSGVDRDFLEKLLQQTRTHNQSLADTITQNVIADKQGVIINSEFARRINLAIGSELLDDCKLASLLFRRAYDGTYEAPPSDWKSFVDTLTKKEAGTIRRSFECTWSAARQMKRHELVVGDIRVRGEAFLQSFGIKGTSSKFLVEAFKKAE
jgi:hypothetical protein